jgi:hypothetical protein
LKLFYDRNKYTVNTGESLSGDVEDVTEGKTEDGSYRY